MARFIATTRVGVMTRSWSYPVICLPFSLLVGLLVKCRNAPTTLEGSILDVVVAVIGAVSVLAWLFIFTQVNKLLWENEFVTTNPWM
jgi:hypothetical protein